MKKQQLNRHIFLPLLMMSNWHIRVFKGRQLVYATEVTGPAVLGRQDKGQGEEKPFVKSQQNGVWRVVIAPFEDDDISRKQVRIEPLSNDKIKVTNLSKRRLLVNGAKLEPDTSSEAFVPTILTLGGKSICIEPVDDEAEVPEMQSLTAAAGAPGHETTTFKVRASASLAAGPGMKAEDLVPWIQAVLSVLQSAAGSLDFFTRAARAVVDLVGLDSGRVLLLETSEVSETSAVEWTEAARQTAAGIVVEPDWQPSHQVLAKVLEEKKTFWQVPAAARASQSLVGVKAVVAAPILDRHGRVIGALYGERRQQSEPGLSRPIARLEAMLVEVLASGVAAGLARVEEEKAALRTRVQFEQFFSPQLAQQLVDNPALLRGRNSEVSILFCDIRGFSRISERLGPAGTTHWVGDVMDSLSECAWQQDGVVIEYVGDEVRAMWGAPDQQPDHARRACRAALSMLQRLPQLAALWQPVLGELMDLGIGIHTGPAWVGNVGSQRKFKYGPQGGTVNLASRTQGATKFLKTNVLITQATQAQLDETFATRRLCQVRVVNISQPVDLYELTAPGRPGWPELKQGYEKALEHFEKKDFRQATAILGSMLPQHPDDGPSLILLSRTVNCLAEEPADFDPVWELPGK